MSEAMTDTVRVDLGARSYDVRVGRGLLARAGAEIAPFLKRPRVTVVTDETVGALHLAALREGLGDVAMTALALPPGEATKGWPQFTRTVEWLLAEKVERRDIVIALGGGVIGDLVGFAAAVLRRGVRFVQIFHGSNGGAGAWDAHGALKSGHTALCKQVDQPIGARAHPIVTFRLPSAAVPMKPSSSLASTSIVAALLTSSTGSAS